MSTSSQSQPVTTDKATDGAALSKNQPSNKPTNCIWLFIMLVISLALMAGAGYFLWQHTQVANDGLAKQLQGHIAQLQATDSKLAAVQKENSQLKKEQAKVQAQYEQMAKMLQDSEVLFSENRTKLALSEAEYLLVFAIQQLTLQKDHATALKAMEAADARVRDLNAPGLMAVRESITSDINNLRAIDDIDITGLALYIADLLGRVGTLPLRENALINTAEKTAAVAIDSKDKAPQSFSQRIWDDIKGMLVITHNESAQPALLLPNEAYFIYQNLRLELANARLAVLHRDTENFRTSIALIIAWLNDYFASNDAAIRNIIVSLEKMSSLELDVALPDISSSLESIRAYTRRGELSTPASK